AWESSCMMWLRSRILRDWKVAAGVLQNSHRSFMLGATTGGRPRIGVARPASSGVRPASRRRAAASRRPATACRAPRGPRPDHTRVIVNHRHRQLVRCSVPEDAVDPDLRAIVTIRTTAARCRLALTAAARHPNAWATAGIHPKHASEALDP